MSESIEGQKIKETEEELRKRIEEDRAKLFAKNYIKNPPTTKELFGAENINEFYDILKDPDLLKKIKDEFDKKIAGEWDTRHAIFLSCCSIWVKNTKLPLNTLINSESSAGKSYVTKRIFEFFPENLREYRTKITPQAFTYWHDSKLEPEWTWNGKILFLEDVSNSLLSSETFKVMCSEGSKATVVINQKAVDIDINGKPCIILTAAESNPKNEIINRFNSLNLDESPEQTHNINQFQAELSKRDAEEYNPDIRKALTLLRRVNVKIPYADKLVNCFPINNIRVRRDFTRFLDLIKSSTAFHQYQRQRESEDTVIANEIDYEYARQALHKMQMTETMVKLTHKERKAYDTCLKLTEQKEGGFRVRDAWKENPFVSERYWYRLIEKLLQNGLLKVELIESEDSRKPVQFFKSIYSKTFELPKYEDL